MCGADVRQWPTAQLLPIFFFLIFLFKRGEGGTAQLLPVVLLVPVMGLGIGILRDFFLILS